MTGQPHSTSLRPDALPGGERVPVAVLGATGSVGQRFISLLHDHPWFELVGVAASERSAGRTYAEAARWMQTEPCPESVREMVVSRSAETLGVPLVFSALDGDVAGELEVAHARAGALVVSNARSHRMAPDVPLLVPEVNPDHLALLDQQDHGRGGIVTNPNCSTIGLALALAPLSRTFGVERVSVVTMQALSGAGLPGVSSLDALDNLIPFIRGEEEKLETEPAKIFGALGDGGVVPAGLSVSAQCNRVAVLDGHTECVSVTLGQDVEEADIVRAWEESRGAPQELGLPSAPAQPILYLADEAAPQPRLHRDLEGGMACAIGRLRPCPLLGWKFVCLSHNTLRGAAGGALLCAELAVAQGRLPR